MMSRLRALKEWCSKPRAAYQQTHRNMFEPNENDAAFVSIYDNEEQDGLNKKSCATTTKRILAIIIPPAVNVGTQLSLNAFAPGLGAVASGLIGCGAQAAASALANHSSDQGSVWEGARRMASSFATGAGVRSAAVVAAESLTSSGPIVKAVSMGTSVVGQSLFYHHDLNKTNRVAELEASAADLAQDPLRRRRSSC